MEEVILVQRTKNTLDGLLESRIGYGRGQQILLRSLYMLLFAEGCETIVLGLLIPLLGDEWEMTTFRKSLLITLVYFGVSIGSYLETYCDKYGRYRFLLLDAVITSLFGLLSVVSTSYEFFAMTRFFYGIGIGIILPLTATYITEVVPGSERAQILTLSRIFWSLGCFCACLLGWFLLHSNKHWRLLLFLLVLPSFYAIYDLYRHGRESLRYLWVNKDFVEVHAIVTMLTRENGRLPIPEQELRYLMDEDPASSAPQEGGSQFFTLLVPKYRSQTGILCVSWVSACFIYYAVMLMLPSILARHAELSSSFQYIFILVISAVEVIAIYSSKFFVDHPFFGRKKSLYLIYCIIAILTILLCVSGENSMALLMVIFIGIKLFSTSGFMVLYPYSAEIYETMLRSTAMGIFSLSGRIATTVLGMIGISALEWFGGMGLYYIFILLSVSTSVLIYKMPYCTLGRQLDI